VKKTLRSRCFLRFGERRQQFHPRFAQALAAPIWKNAADGTWLKVGAASRHACAEIRLQEGSTWALSYVGADFRSGP